MTRSGRPLLHRAPDAVRGLILCGAVIALLAGDGGGWFLLGAFALAVVPRVVGVARPFDARPPPTAGIVRHRSPARMPRSDDARARRRRAEPRAAQPALATGQQAEAVVQPSGVA